jgi:hypothetical protein
MCRYVSHLSCIIFVLAAVSFFTAAVSAHDAGFDGRAAVGGATSPLYVTGRLANESPGFPEGMPVFAKGESRAARNIIFTPSYAGGCQVRRTTSAWSV